MCVENIKKTWIAYLKKNIQKIFIIHIIYIDKHVFLCFFL